MSVPKSRRKNSKFEAQHHYFMLRNEVTTLILRDFGFDKQKYQESIEKYRQDHRNAPNVDELTAKWEQKCQSFARWFIDSEASAILEIMRNIEMEFTFGNSIFPSETPAKIMEFLTRRWHINKAIGYCYALKQELNYVIRTLPVDINKYERFAEAIDKQIALYKGVRQADNRLIKTKEKGTLEENMFRVFDGAASVLHQFERMRATEKTDE